MPTPNQILYQYECSGCSSILKESPIEILAPSAEPCPICGSPLSETLRKKRARENTNQDQQDIPALRTAFDLSAPKFGIYQLDAIVARFATSICLLGSRISQSLFWRAIVRSLMPKRAGGSGFSKVLLIDAGNSSDIYLCVDYARQFGISLERLLDGIIVTRAFTVYQLAALVRDVGKAARRFGADMIAVADLSKMFVTDPQMQKEEGRLASKIGNYLASASSQTPLMAFTSLSSSTSSSEWVARFDTIIEVLEGKNRILVSTRSGSVRRSVTIQEEQVLLVKEV